MYLTCMVIVITKKKKKIKLKKNSFTLLFYFKISKFFQIYLFLKFINFLLSLKHPCFVLLGIHCLNLL